MSLPTPSVTQPRIHLWTCPPYGTTAVEQHGAFLPMNKLYLAGSTSAPTSNNSVRNVWSGYGFPTNRGSTAADFALRFVDDHLEAMKATWGLADAYQNALFHIAFSVGTGTGIVNLLNHASDAITGSYRDLDRTLFTANGIADVAQFFDSGSFGLPAAIDARLVASSNTAYRPALCCQDMEFARPRCYNACNTGTNGNWSGQTGDARASTENIITDLTGVALALTPELGHASDLTLAAIDAVMSNFGNTNLSWTDASNIAAAREYEAWSMAVDDNAMARAVYQHLLAVWGTALCGNYDTCAGTAIAPHRYHGAKLGALGYAAATAHHFGANCPVLYPLEEAKDDDEAALLAAGWGPFAPNAAGTSIDTLAVSKAYVEAMILAHKASGISKMVPWVQFPGITTTNGGSTVWRHQVVFVEWVLRRLFTEGLCENIIIWDWESGQDWDLLVSVVDRAAASAGISWAA